MSVPPAYSAFLKRRLQLWSKPAAIADQAVRSEIETLRTLNKKLTAYDFAAAHGVLIPNHRSLESFKDIASDPWVSQLSEFVVKPKSGHSSKGVYVLSRQEDGSLRCEMNQRVFQDIGAVVADYGVLLRATNNAYAMGAAVIVEERIIDSHDFKIPLDYKVYAFGSQVPLVMQRLAANHLPKDQWAFEFYDPSGRRLGPIRKGTEGAYSPDKLPAPRSIDQLVRAARSLSEASKVTFMRIDLYETPAGVVFGEFTPVPNAAKESFVPEYESLLGKCWHDRCVELGVAYHPLDGNT